MWKDYSLGYIKNNRSSGLSVAVAALISSLLLSLLCSLFYNLWNYEIQRIKAEEGGWQGRITGTIDGEMLETIRSHANVEKAVVNRELSQDSTTTVDIYLKEVGSVLRDLPQIAEMAGLGPEAVSYHNSLLNLYLIRDAKDPALRWIFPFFLAVTVIACLSLILVIHNAFGVTMRARIHQFGIFSSIGATPRQIRACLLQEAFVLCAVPLVVGNLLGILICAGLVKGINVWMTDVSGRLQFPFAYHPLILLLSLLAAAVTVWISAWIPARRMGKLTPLEAIRNTGELSLKRRKRPALTARLFGVEGELAGAALKAQRSSMRTATLSLVLSFLAFSLMMCCVTVIVLSQRETYFERYQDAWDVMAQVENPQEDLFFKAEAVRTIPGVDGAAVYQKALAKRLILPGELSGELQAIGGLSHAPARDVTVVSEGWLVNVPLIILDDESFLEYCGQIGAELRTDGAVILNRTKDATDPNFRKRRSLPYLTGEGQTTVLRQEGSEESTAELSVIAYTSQPPRLREEYGSLDLYELVHFIPRSVWQEIGGGLGETEAETYIRILARDRTSLEELDKIQEVLSEMLAPVCEAKLENRIRERRDNDRMMKGMMVVVGMFCGLLAVIGIGNVFSNTLGFVHQRRREFARYLSIGLTPAGMKKIFFAEALVIAGRPVLITVPITMLVVIFFLKASYLEPMVFLREAPLVPILAFLAAIFAFVALAYYLGGRRMLRMSLVETLRDDTML